MYITNDDIGAKINFKNTVSQYAPPVFRPDENLITNKMPVELSSDLSSLLDDKIQNLLTHVQYVQQIIDESDYNPLHELAKHKDVVYHSDTGLIRSGEIPGLMGIDLNTHHSVSLAKYYISVNGKTGYCFDHEIHDTFEINSTIADILKINIDELWDPTVLDIMHIKPFTTPPYKPFNPSMPVDGVFCQLSLSGNTTLWSTTSPRNTDFKSYSEKLSSTKLTAFNPYIIGARTTTSNNSYILNIRFKEMTFTKLLKLTNTK